ncbi:acyltransferase [Geothrix fuzhouensis]|uniref:acyltransferase n=1 Tax=Geothrix fuzhouensis TaxID=2966451 RepID=UPI002148E8B5|nr:acyltransferase [Geothrix fuzhouensis]
MFKVLTRLVRKAIWATILHPKLLKIPITILDRLIIPQWQKAWGLYCQSQVKRMDPTSRFLGRVWVNYPEGLTIGPHVRIGRGCFLFCLGGLKIGDGSVLSRNITIYTANHNTRVNHIPYDNSYIRKSVSIGQGVWIGMDVRITPGVTIGDGAVIGMGTVVSRDIPEGAIVVGSPQRIVGERDNSMVRQMIENQMFFAAEWPDA